MSAAKKPKQPQSRKPLPVQPKIEYLPAVEFKVADDIDWPDQGPGFCSGSTSLASWIPARHPLHPVALTLHTEHLLKSTTAEQIDRLVARAREINPAFTPIRYENLLRARTPDVATAHQVAAALRALPSIDFAEVQRVVPLPGVVTPTDDPLSADEVQLDPPRSGINARAAWDVGADGSGVTLVDLERGYDPHEDLPTNIFLAHGDPSILRILDAGHGTAVLGILGGLDNSKGIVGIAPATQLGFSMRYWGNVLDERILDALLGALSKLQYGDVLLIDDQYGEDRNGSSYMVPVELHDVIKQNLSMIQSLGVVFVEPSGNNSESIDARCATDSGAIIVGGINSTSFRREDYEFQSNYGARVDCHARYGGIVTTGWEGGYAGSGGMNSPDAYTNSFRGTSATAAIVAGAACLLQSYVINNLGYRFSPDSIRTFLRTYGLKSNDPTNDQVGIMPDVGECIKNLPDPTRIVIRAAKDFSERVSRPWGGCPWIIVKHVPDPDPAPYANVSVTVRADSVDGARDVYADLYQAPPAFFPMPRDWTPIGRAWIGDVGGGRIQHTSVAPVRWNDSVATAWGGASLIAVFGHRKRPAPERFGIRTERELQRFLANNSIVGVRTKLVSRGIGKKRVFNIPIVAPRDLKGPLRIEIRQTFPAGTRAALVLPHELLAGNVPERVTIPVGALRRIEIPLEPGGRTRVRVEIETPNQTAAGGFELALFSGENACGRMFGDLKGTP